MNRAVLLFALAAAACGTNPGGGGGSDGDYFPHGIASSWQYERYGSVDTLGVTFVMQGERSVTVSASMSGGGAEFAELSSLGYDTLYAAGIDSLFLPLAGVTVMRIDGSGVWTFTDTLMTDSVMIARFPLTVGDSWSAHQDPQVTGQVIAMDETVDVPDGTFEDVLHLRLHEPGTVQTVTDLWFAPGTGCIASGVEVSAAGSVVLYELDEELVSHFVY